MAKEKPQNTPSAPTSSSYRDSLKSMDTEEGIDLAFYRPIGYAWACLARKLGITPNVITVASIFLGLGAGYCFYFSNLWINVVGMLLLVWANSFDSADGQLARMTGQYSRLGRILDGLSGDLWFFAIYLAICLRENVTSQFFMAYPWAIWVMAALTGVCHAKQAAMADYYRQFHLFFLKGRDGSELENYSQLHRQLEQIPWKGHFWKKLTLSFYANYTRQQEATTPAMQSLRRELRRRFPSGIIPDSFRADFRRASLPLMKFTNILSFNWRTIALFTALFLTMPWMYFAFELTVLNALLIYMVLRHESICRKFTTDLENGKY
ncbi:MAG: CDP-alcohol phosphatidyltransferase family protein [Firmicutes bacterium]|nr:CDP-alcohol phosphatidyltransferase family protein [Bacillota bacterium]MCM1400549.1 CDP-alcohol phosphatidyltransferase family protein [Bacteroides sp.]MCM1476453.1 CDP-alcohol phosphatidyltransferase family protein [Bacteroides sp.]